MFDPEVVEELRRQFQAADRNGDGEIDAGEACAHFAKCCSPTATEAEIKQTAEGLRHQMDADRSGTISFDEYCFRFGRKYQMERNRLRRAELASGPEEGLKQKTSKLDLEKEREALARERETLDLEKERETLKREREALERERQAFRAQADGQAGGAPRPSAPPPEQPPLAAGARVKLQGLQGAAELNGRIGIILRFDTPAGRYVVEVDGGAGQKSLKGDNLVLQGTAGLGGGAGGAAGGAAGGSGGPSAFADFGRKAQDAAKQAYLQVQMWLADYETWQIAMGVGLIVLFVAAWFQVSTRYPGGGEGGGGDSRSSSSSSFGSGSGSRQGGSAGHSGRGGGGGRTQHHDSGADRSSFRDDARDDGYGDSGYGDSDYDDGHRGGGGHGGYGGGGGGGLLGFLGSGGPMQWYLIVGGLGFLCWKGIIPIHKMSWFQLYMLWNFIQPLLMGGGRGGGMTGGFGRGRRRSFF